MMMSLSSLTDRLTGRKRQLSGPPPSLLLFLSSSSSSSSPGTELSSRAIFQPIYFLMWSNLGHLPLGRLYVVINDGYLAQVPGGPGSPSAQHRQVQHCAPGPDRTGRALQQTGERQTGAISVTAPPPTRRWVRFITAAKRSPACSTSLE